MIFHCSETQTFDTDNPMTVEGELISVLGIFTDRSSAHVVRVPKDGSLITRRYAPRHSKLPRLISEVSTLFRQPRKGSLL